MDHDLIRSQMPALVSGHVPRNARSFTFAIYDGLPQLSMLGFRLDPKPFEGKVIASNDEAIVVKTGRTTFAVLNRDLVTEQPTEGSKVRVTPYARYRFDGQRADTPEEKVDYASDGTPYVIKTHVLGSAVAKLPVPKPECYELAALIEQLEQMPAPDGFRSISHLLVDAKAKNFSLVDPQPEDILRTPPAINFDVETTKFTGQVSVLYDRGMDVYVIELRRNGELLQRLDEVYFDCLGDTLQRLIDDGRWRQIHVELLTRP
ncbi:MULTISPECIES: GTPase [Pseudomonas]|uniref:GTPase n=1 Tax=Pseudomonas TaxID=286 RepID=UPI0023603F8C|nr:MULTISPECIES: GTPase [Pseudomonas]WJV25660.1 GTPase [Pseudomonas chlororaphis]